MTRSKPTILALDADQRLVALLEARLPRLSLQASEAQLTILLATAALARSAEDGLIGKALEAWSQGRLLVVSVNGATPPLGLRDVERVTWTPSKDDAPRLSQIADQLSRLGAKLTEEGRGEGPSAAMPSQSPQPSSPGPKSRSRRMLPMLAAFLVCAGLASAVLTAQFMRNSAPAPQVTAERASPPPPKSPPAPMAAPAPAGPRPAPAPAPAPPAVSPAAPPMTGAPPPSAPVSPPDLSAPSGAGGGPPPSPAGAPRARLGAEALDGSGIWPWLAGGLVGLVLLGFVVMWRRKPPETIVAETFTPAPPAAGRPSPAVAEVVLGRVVTGTGGERRIFVSYSHQDIARVDPIVAEIEKLGHPVWIDRRELSGGPGWAGQIVRGLRAARTVVLMASRHAYASDQVVREMYLAMSEKKTIVPFELESAEIPDELLYILAPFQRHRLEAGDSSKIIYNALAAL